MTCLFCAIAAGEQPAHLVLAEPDVVGFLETRPLFKGHTLLVPRRHVGTLVDIDTPPLGAVTRAAQRAAARGRGVLMGGAEGVAAALVAALGAQGSFVAMNNVVSQSVPHLHVHVVPRTKGDGLRGFFWPRSKYGSDAEAATVAARVRAAVSPAR